MKNSVEVWEDEVIIPTYPVGEPEKNPMFFEKRVYQGSSGVVYPNPIIEKVYDEKVDKKYNGLFLENKYLKIMVLPEIGGRVQTAYDKVKERHFVYHNRVIKPALVGLLGPWISGGIEFNWPQHHRPSTFQPIDYTLEENEDGSKTIWANEVELMFHTKGMAGFTIYPDKAYLEINVQLYNRTKLPQTFLWWANPAVSVNDHYQSVFPQDVNAVFDHGKRDVATFPIAEGTYYKVDYSPGTDISNYKNIPVPTSYMAIQSDYDFVGGYEHDTEGGLLHVANHHVSPGKKQWTWGNGDFGKSWDRNLTDEDGPYIELMTGVYTDNQPDFSWLMPAEEKSFSQYFLPYQDLGVVKNANKDFLLNIEVLENNKAQISIYATAVQNDIQITLWVDGDRVFEDRRDISPELVYHNTVDVEPAIEEENYILILADSEDMEIIRYEPAQNREEDIPDPAQPAKAPEDIKTIEQLYLTGLHLEQYRHATYRPEPYYKEALRRNPSDVRNNNAFGKWYLRQGRFEKAVPYFKQAIETVTERSPNPYYGEAYYNLGVALNFLNKQNEAYAAFYKATWNAAWQDKAYFELAEINTARGEYKKGLKHINYSLDRNARNGKAWTLKAAILRRMDCLEEALEVTNTAIERDTFNLSAYFERQLIYKAQGNSSKGEAALNRFLELSRRDDQNLMAYALDYGSAGLFDEALSLLTLALDTDEVCANRAYTNRANTVRVNTDRTDADGPGDDRENIDRANTDRAFTKSADADRKSTDGADTDRSDADQANADTVGYDRPDERIHPMVYYYLGWFSIQSGEMESADTYFEKAANANPAYCFPNRLEAIPALNEAIESNNKDAKAPYYLGCLFYDKRQYEPAINCWETSRGIDDAFPTVHRNLGIAYYNKQEDPAGSVDSFEKAFALDTSDARMFMELDQLYKRTNKDPKERLDLLENNPVLVARRDDLYLERAALYNFIGEYEKAYQLIMGRKFHPVEGGEGMASAQYVYSLTEMAKEDVYIDACEVALEKLEEAQHYPHNLGEGKLFGTRENDIFYWMGVAHEKLGNADEAVAYWHKATEGDYEPTAAVFYNDQPPEKILYQALAWQKLGEGEKAQQIYRDLIEFGEEHMEDDVQIDYFAVSLPDLLIFDADLSQRNKIHCKFMIGLGYIGLNQLSKAKSIFKDILDAEAMHIGAKTHLKLTNWIEDEFVIEKTAS